MKHTARIEKSTLWDVLSLGTLCPLGRFVPGTVGPYVLGRFFCAPCFPLMSHDENYEFIGRTSRPTFLLPVVFNAFIPSLLAATITFPKCLWRFPFLRYCGKPTINHAIICSFREPYGVS